MKRLITLILAFSMLLSACASAEMVVIEPSNCYESEKKLSMKAENAVNTMAYGSETLGSLILSGTIVNESNIGKIPAIAVNYDTDCKFSYTFITDMRSSSVPYSKWRIEEENSKKVDDIKLDNKIGYGCIIIQKSDDGENWSTVNVKYDVFEDYEEAIHGIYTPTKGLLNKGCYFRFIVAYKLQKQLNSKKILFVDTSDYTKRWNVEEYIVYVFSENGESEKADMSDIEINGVSVDTVTGLGALSIADLTTANRIAGEEIFSAGETGHGFAAEAANIQNATIKGLFNGDEVTHTGGNNAKDGDDYQIKGKTGVTTFIQSKYYKTAADTVNACFNEKGIFRYYTNINGVSTPMQIEVPADQYEEAIVKMQAKISSGCVPGVDDPAEAENIIRKGTVTYEQAKNIAKAGNLDSITYDAKNSCVLAATALGVSAAVQFATSIWNGEDVEVALKDSIYTGLKIGGNAFVTSVLSSQLTKSGLNSLLVPGSEAITKALGYKASEVIINAARVGAKPIYGAAAMKSAAKLLRSNAITGTVSLLVFTVPDIVNIFRGRISAKQLLKNTAVTAGGIGGGFAGAAAGAAVGSVVPVIGTTVGGIAGAIIGGVGGSAGVDAVADIIAEDDADEMLDIITEEFKTLADEYLLNQEEAENISAKLQESLSAGTLKDMYSAKDHAQYARTIIEPLVQDEISTRKIVKLPDEEEITEGLSDTLEDIYDEYVEEGNENNG